MTQAVLLIVFIAIFVATAAITLASLVGWVTIPEFYRKALFTSLILEVVGGVILLFNNSFNPNQTPIQLEANWIGLDYTTGSLLRPRMKVANDTIEMGASLLVAQEVLKKNVFGITQKDNAFYVEIPKDNFVIGQIQAQSLKENRLFNQLDIGRDDHDVVIFSNNGNGWGHPDKQLENWPFDIRVSDSGIGTSYIIKDRESGEERFNSAGRELFDSGKRKVHFFEIHEAYYILRITGSEMDISENRFVTFMLLRLNPDLTP